MPLNQELEKINLTTTRKTLYNQLGLIFATTLVATNLLSDLHDKESSARSAPSVVRLTVYSALSLGIFVMSMYRYWCLYYHRNRVLAPTEHFFRGNNPWSQAVQVVIELSGHFIAVIGSFLMEYYGQKDSLSYNLQQALKAFSLPFQILLSSILNTMIDREINRLELQPNCSIFAKARTTFVKTTYENIATIYRNARDLRRNVIVTPTLRSTLENTVLYYGDDVLNRTDFKDLTNQGCDMFFSSINHFLDKTQSIRDNKVVGIPTIVINTHTKLNFLKNKNAYAYIHEEDAHTIFEALNAYKNVNQVEDYLTDVASSIYTITYALTHGRPIPADDVEKILNVLNAADLQNVPILTRLQNALRADDLNSDEHIIDLNNALNALNMCHLSILQQRTFLKNSIANSTQQLMNEHHHYKRP